MRVSSYRDHRNFRLPLRDSQSRLLWEGNWASGSITVPGISSCRLIGFELGNGVMHTVGYSTAVAFVIGAFTDNNSAATLGQYRLRFNASGDTLTIVDSAYYTASGSRYQHNVRRIYKLV